MQPSPGLFLIQGECYENVHTTTQQTKAESLPSNTRLNAIGNTCDWFAIPKNRAAYA